MMLRSWAGGVLSCAALAVACSGPKFGGPDAAGGAGGHAGAAVAGASAGRDPEPAGGAGKGGGSGGSGGVVAAGADARGGDDAGEGGEPAQSECPCAAPTPTCERGKCVVRGPVLIDAGKYYVDSTEVTVGDYALFEAARGDDTSGQSAECAWNDSFKPAVRGIAPDHPVTHVDFCDAAAYCAWADKRLCGKIGGGPVALPELADATKSEWFAACAGPKQQPYPYGTQHQAAACNDATAQAALAPVGSFPSCAGFHEGTFDLLGNVAEWVNACVAAEGAVDGCETIGGSHADTPTCSSSSLKHRDEQLPTVGFRCCSG